jgi:hypothetical protein
VLYGLITDVVRDAQKKELIRSDLDPVAVTQVMFSFFIGLENQKSYDPNLDVAAYVEVAQGMLSGTFRWKEAPGGNEWGRTKGANAGKT